MRAQDSQITGSYTDIPPKREKPVSHMLARRSNVSIKSLKPYTLVIDVNLMEFLHMGLNRIFVCKMIPI